MASPTSRWPSSTSSAASSSSRPRGSGSSATPRSAENDRPGRCPATTRCCSPSVPPGRASSTSPGASLKGVELAMPFLTQQNRRGLGDLVQRRGDPRHRQERDHHRRGRHRRRLPGHLPPPAGPLGPPARLQPPPAREREPGDPLAALAQDPPHLARHEEGGKRDWQIKTKQFVGDDRATSRNCTPSASSNTSTRRANGSSRRSTAPIWSSPASWCCWRSASPDPSPCCPRPSA